MKREKAIEIVNQLSEEFHLDDLIERLIFVDKVEKGIEQANQGMTKTAEEVKRNLRSSSISG
jgi:hypothetical protein